MSLIDSKGCTLFPDKGIGACCITHDTAYAEQLVTRWQADVALLICGAQAGYPWRAIVAFAGVRAFGWIRWYWLRRKLGRANARFFWQNDRNHLPPSSRL